MVARPMYEFDEETGRWTAINSCFVLRKWKPANDIIFLSPRHFLFRSPATLGTRQSLASHLLYTKMRREYIRLYYLQLQLLIYLVEITPGITFISNHLLYTELRQITPAVNLFLTSRMNLVSIPKKQSLSHRYLIVMNCRPVWSARLALCWV